MLVIVLDLIAGLLIGAQFLVPRKLHKRMDGRLRDLLRIRSDMQNPLKKKNLIWSIIPTGILLIGIIVWALLQDVAEGMPATGQLATSIVLALAGVIAGIGSMIFIIWVIKLLILYIARYIHYLGTYKSIYSVMIISIILTIAAILVFRVTPVNFAIFIATYVITVSIFGGWMEATPLAQKYLTFESGVLARFGLIVFITSKVIQLNYYL